MNLKIAFALSLLIITANARAELSGDLTDTGGDGTYNIMIESDEDGHVYNGKAVDIGNGQLRVEVGDGLENYKGIASPDETGDFHFDLVDKNSGRSLVGSIDNEDQY